MFLTLSILPISLVPMPLALLARVRTTAPSINCTFLVGMLISQRQLLPLPAVIRQAPLLVANYRFTMFRTLFLLPTTAALMLLALPARVRTVAPLMAFLCRVVTPLFQKLPPLLHAVILQAPLAVASSRFTTLPPTRRAHFQLTPVRYWRGQHHNCHGPRHSRVPEA